MADPILKWAGGKRKLSDEIIALMPKDYRNRTYHEPFFGGGAIFFQIKPKKGSINDVNKHLINFYRIVRDKPDELVETARQYPYDKKVYYELRDRFNHEEITDVEQAALLLYFNKTGFNGLYRVNSKNEFNVPFGRYKNPTIVPENRIYEASELLEDVEIFNKDFTYIIDYSNPGDLVYFDPPYLPVSDTADFTSYSSDGFSYDDQLMLVDTCKKLDEKDAYFVLSNSSVKLLVDKYEEYFTVHTVQAARSINSKASKRGAVNEILVSNIPEDLSQSLTAFFKK
ncbi:MAG: DNA adenine methylase [archaeon]